MIGPEERRRARLLDDLPGRLARVVAWRPAPAQPSDGQRHHVPTLVACLAGVVRVSRPGDGIDLQPGDVLLLAPGTIHEHVPLRAGSVAFGLGFMHRCSDLVLYDHRCADSGRIPEQPVRLLMERALAVGDAAARRSAARELIGQALSEPVEALPHERHPAVRRMLHAMWGGLHRGITAADLVRASRLGRARAWQLFRSVYGTTPYRALAEARLEMAIGLVQGGLPISEAATAAGFHERRMLTRAWRRRFGRPPRAMRRADPC
jgi:AraC-like DNA-binding protein